MRSEHRSASPMTLILRLMAVVTVRDRDTMKQERVAIADLKAYFEEKFDF